MVASDNGINNMKTQNEGLSSKSEPTTLNETTVDNTCIVCNEIKENHASTFKQSSTIKRNYKRRKNYKSNKLICY